MAALAQRVRWGEAPGVARSRRGKSGGCTGEGEEPGAGGGFPAPFLREGLRGRANGGQSRPPPTLRGERPLGPVSRLAAGGCPPPPTLPPRLRRGPLPSGRTPPGRASCGNKPTSSMSVPGWSQGWVGGEGERGLKRPPGFLREQGCCWGTRSPPAPPPASPKGCHPGAWCQPLIPPAPGPGRLFWRRSRARVRQGPRPGCHLHNNVRPGVAKGVDGERAGGFERGEEGDSVAGDSGTGVARLLSKECV